MQFYKHLPASYTITSYTFPVQAGFPSPAEDYQEKPLSLDELLIDHPLSTFFVRIEGDSMSGDAISEGDIAVIDRSIDPKPNNIVLAHIKGSGYTVKRLIKKSGKAYLSPSNKKYPDIELNEFCEARIWGVVVAIVRKTV